MKQLAIYISSITEPAANLALEEALFRSRQDNENILLFYSNRPSVILGRNQNPWLECGIPELSRRGIPYLRRFSGGGTVYHDLDNLNYSFITSRKEFERSAATGLIVKALKVLGIPAAVSTRNDITLEDRKISGSAYRLASDSAYHHGTLLIDSNLDDLHALLHSTASIRDAAGTRSVSSPVINIRELHPGVTKTAVITSIAETFQHNHQGGKQEIHTVEDIAACRQLTGFESLMGQLANPDWIYGKTPRFTLLIPVPAQLLAVMLHDHDPGNLPVGNGIMEIAISKGRIGTVSVGIDNPYPHTGPEQFKIELNAAARSLVDRVGGKLLKLSDLSPALARSVTSDACAESLITDPEGPGAHSVPSGKGIADLIEHLHYQLSLYID